MSHPNENENRYSVVLTAVLSNRCPHEIGVALAALLGEEKMSVADVISAAISMLIAAEWVAETIVNKTPAQIEARVDKMLSELRPKLKASIREGYADSKKSAKKRR